MPPSTMSSVPVMYLASSETSKSTAFAVSRPSPMNGRGMRFWRLSSSAWTSPAACWVARNASTRGVCNCPGNTVLIRTPCLAYSTAATRPNCITPAFAAAYPTWGAPVQRIADVEETLTTAPLP
ncbi:hypothetical protein G6F50_018019 [Rhizopus delemar]|uniref:Uncharacterized protein n=1 Tax=Rhizopus delemar TaxID=936053 RepID=A0A9P6XNF2_9FUNG|nr:hypothetical protein G6F50_018019 [Rhizopus delemar]